MSAPAPSRRTFLGGLAAALAEPGALRAAPRACPRLRRGINFHHLLNWPQVTTGGEGVAYVWPPFRDRAHQLEAADLRRAHALGFDFVRVTVDPGLLIAEAGTARRSQLQRRVRSVVDALLDAQFDVVVDLHPVNVNPAYAPERLTAPEAQALTGAYADMVACVAGWLISAPPGRVALEPFNEPPLFTRSDKARWPDMMARLHAAVRAVAPDLPVVVCGARWDDLTELMALDLAPYRDSNAIYTFHYYEPHLFTHQGVHDDVTAYVSGLGWPVRGDDARAALARALALVAADADLTGARREAAIASLERQFAPLVAGGHDPARIAADFHALGAWADRQGVPRSRVLLGEFGCVITARGEPLGPSRFNWLAAVRDAAEREGFGWAYWALKGYGGMELQDADGRLHVDVAERLGLATPAP